MASGRPRSGLFPSVAISVRSQHGRLLSPDPRGGSGAQPGIPKCEIRVLIKNPSSETGLGAALLWRIASQKQPALSWRLACRLVETSARESSSPVVPLLFPVIPAPTPPHMLQRGAGRFANCLLPIRGLAPSCAQNTWHWHVPCVSFLKRPALVTLPPAVLDSDLWTPVDSSYLPNICGWQLPAQQREAGG